MKYGKIRNVRNSLSRVIFGCAIAPMIEGENVNELLDAVLALGINTFDTAEAYGMSEASLGQWLRAGIRREDVVIISKGCHPYDGRQRVTPEDLKHDIEQSFERLGTDYIDIYLLHRDNREYPVGPIVEILNAYRRAGKIGAFGGSNWTHLRIAEANQYALEHGLMPFTVSSPNFSLCTQIGDPWGGGDGCVTISGPSRAEAREWYIRNQIPVLAYASLGHGMFSGKVKSDDMEGAREILDPFAVKGYCYPENFERLARVEKLAAQKNCTVPQIALAWVLNQEVDTYALVSSGSVERMASNAGAADIALSKNELRWLDLCC